MEKNVILQYDYITNQKKGFVSIRSFLLAFVIFLISFFISIVLFLDDSAPSYYDSLFLLPLIFGIINLICCSIYDSFSNVGIVSIVTLECFRMVITPFMMYMGNYYSVMKINISNNMSTAIILMIYECIAVFLMLLYENSKRKRCHAGELVNTFNKIKTSNKIKYLVFIMVSFLVGVAVFIPEAISAFKTILDVGSSSFTTWSDMGTTRFETGTLIRIIATLFTMIFSWVRYLLPIAFIIWCKNHFSARAALILSMIPIVLQVFFITATIMESILCAFVLLIVLIKIYPQYKKLLLNASIFGIAIVIGGYFLIRYRTKNAENIWRFFSENAIAYTSGIDNVAAVLNVGEKGKWSTFFFNIYGAIPFNSTLFGLSGDKLAAVFNVANGRTDGHIPPTIGAGWYYYGFLFAPIESIILTKLSLKFGAKAQTEKNIWKYAVWVLTAIMLAMGFNAYNMAIVLNYLTTLIIPLYIISLFSDNEGIRKKKRQGA